MIKFSMHYYSFFIDHKTDNLYVCIESLFFYTHYIGYKYVYF